MGLPTSIIQFPPELIATRTDYDGGSAPVYNGMARSIQASFTFDGATVSKAASASVGYTAHGLQSGQLATFSGGTGDWAALNGTRVITRTGANTFTVAVNTSAYTGTWGGTISTVAPRENAACWYLTKTYYTGANPTSTGSALGMHTWDERASVGYN